MKTPRFEPFPAINKPPFEAVMDQHQQGAKVGKSSDLGMDFFDRYYKKGWPETGTSDVKVVGRTEQSRGSVRQFQAEPFTMKGETTFPLVNAPSVPDFLRFAVPMEQLSKKRPQVSQRRMDLSPTTLSYAQAKYYH